MSDSTEARKWVRARLKEGVDAATIKKQLEAATTAPTPAPTPEALKKALPIVPIIIHSSDSEDSDGGKNDGKGKNDDEKEENGDGKAEHDHDDDDDYDQGPKPEHYYDFYINFEKARAFVNGEHDDYMDFCALLSNEGVEVGIGKGYSESDLHFFIQEYCSVPAPQSSNGGYESHDAYMAVQYRNVYHTQAKGARWLHGESRLRAADIWGYFAAYEVTLSQASSSE